MIVVLLVATIVLSAAAVVGRAKCRQGRLDSTKWRPPPGAASI